MNYKNYMDLFRAGVIKMRPKSVETTIFNMIPISTQPAIAGGSVFSSFNNTIYALAYEDKLDETRPFNWLNQNGEPVAYIPDYYKEGYDLAHNQRYIVPTYTHFIAQDYAEFENPGFDVNTEAYGKQEEHWDPMYDPDALLELRPGKNAIKFQHNIAGDEYKWIDIRIRKRCSRERFWNQNGTGIPYTAYQQVTKDYSGAEQPVTPNRKYICPNIILQGDREFHDAGLNNNPLSPGRQLGIRAEESYKYPIPQIFIKMIPLYDAQNALIQTTSQICITSTIVLECIISKHTATGWPFVNVERPFLKTHIPWPTRHDPAKGADGTQWGEYKSIVRSSTYGPTVVPPLDSSQGADELSDIDE